MPVLQMPPSIISGILSLKYPITSDGSDKERESEILAEVVANGFRMI